MNVVMLLQDVLKTYGKVVPVNQISLDIFRGEIFGILGANGAGKSTLLSMMAGIMEPSSGSIFFLGEDLYHKGNKSKSLIGFVPQDIALYSKLSGFDNLYFWGKAYGLRGKELDLRVENILEVIGFKEKMGEAIENFSGGMKRRLNIAVSLLHQPELIIMDEPTVGIDMQSRKKIWEAVIKLKNKGRTIVFTSHYPDDIKLCDRLAVLEEGKLISLGTLEELREREGALEGLIIQE